MVTAHSGCEGRPDNSLEYVRYALTCGADALEVDVHPRGTGFYISHDVSEGDCPDLAAVFSLARNAEIQINCDLKEPGMEEGVLALAARHGMADRLIFSGTVSRQALKSAEICRRTFWNLECVLPALLRDYEETGSVPPEAKIRAAARACREQGVAALNVHYSICTERNLAIFREEGTAVSAWTVDDPSVARVLLDAGVRNITTRRPTVVCPLRGQP